MRSPVVVASILLVFLLLTGCSPAAEPVSNTGTPAVSADEAPADSDTATPAVDDGDAVADTATGGDDRIDVGPLVPGNVDGSGKFVSSLDEYQLVNEAVAYQYGMECDRFSWGQWQGDPPTWEVTYATQPALESIAADAAALAGSGLKRYCTPSDVTLAQSGATMKLAVTTDPDAANKIGEMADGSTDEDAIAANMSCQTTAGTGSEISLAYCATSREGKVLIVAYHRPATENLDWLAAVVNAYADNDGVIQVAIDSVAGDPGAP